MPEKIIPLFLFLCFCAFGVSFFMATEKWRKCQLSLLVLREKDLGEMPVLGWWLRLNIKWLRGNFGAWYTKTVGTILFALSILFFLLVL